MWNRKEMKEQGKTALKRNYWKSVLVSAVFAGMIGGAGFYGSSATNNAQDGTNIAFNSPWVVIGTAVIVVLALAAVVLTFAFIANPFEVGVNKFRLNALRDKGNISDVGSGFDVSYKRNVKVLFFRDLYMMLWLFFSSFRVLSRYMNTE